MRRYRPGRIAALCLLGLLAVIPAGAADDGNPILEDDYVADDEPLVDRPVLGDLAIAGMRPRVAARVAGDLLAAGGWVSLDGEVGDDVRAAGGWLELDGRVGDHAALAGFSVTLGPRADIGGRAWLGGDRVRIAGRVRGPLHIAAREVTITGRIDGPARIVARQLTIGDGARIGDELVYRAPEPARVERGATVDGVLTFHRDPGTADARQPPPDRDDGPGIGGLMLWVIALMIPGMILRIAAPGLLAQGHETVWREPLLSLGIGGLLLLVVPLAALVLCVLIVTIPFALALLVLVPPLALIGYLVTAGAIGERIGSRISPERIAGLPGYALALAGALLLLGLGQAIPWLGGLVLLAATLVGTGAAAVATRRRLQGAT